MKKRHLIFLTLIILLITTASVHATGAETIYNFSDFGTIEKHWARFDIETLMNHKGINGLPDGQGGYKFEPERDITTAELLSIIEKTSGNAPTDTAWPAGTMNKAIELGLIPESMKEQGNKPISRQEMAMVLVNAAEFIRNEDIDNVSYDRSKISDLSTADVQYQNYIETAYGLGLLKGTGNGYMPLKPTSRAETCVIINRLFEYVNRVQVNTVDKQVVNTSPAPDGSNVDSDIGMVYPREGDAYADGSGVVTRDETTGVLGFGNGQKGGIYLGVTANNGVSIQVGSGDTGSFYDNINGYYEEAGGYIFWTKEWNMIQGACATKVQQIENPQEGMVADIYGNLTTGTYEDDHVFFEYTDGQWWSLFGYRRNN